jgi:hypothetical protein
VAAAAAYLQADLKLLLLLVQRMPLHLLPLLVQLLCPASRQQQQQQQQHPLLAAAPAAGSTPACPSSPAQDSPCHRCCCQPYHLQLLQQHLHPQLLLQLMCLHLLLLLLLLHVPLPIPLQLLQQLWSCCRCRHPCRRGCCC